jgi:hypothetical protein
MGETGGKSATSEDEISAQTSPFPTRSAFRARPASLALYEPVGQEYFFPCRSGGPTMCFQGFCFFLCQASFFLSE